MSTTALQSCASAVDSQISFIFSKTFAKTSLLYVLTVPCIKHSLGITLYVLPDYILQIVKTKFSLLWMHRDFIAFRAVRINAEAFIGSRVL